MNFRDTRQIESRCCPARTGLEFVPSFNKQPSARLPVLAAANGRNSSRVIPGGYPRHRHPGRPWPVLDDMGRERSEKYVGKECGSEEGVHRARRARAADDSIMAEGGRPVCSAPRRSAVQCRGPNRALPATPRQADGTDRLAPRAQLVQFSTKKK